jgi:predicted DNA-binding protein (MmcQ/YjbR family)
MPLQVFSILLMRSPQPHEGACVTYEEFNDFCRSLAATTYVVQWGGSHVWKVGGRVFAIGGWERQTEAYTFKVTPIAFEILKSRPGLRPAPYLASRGMTWIQHFAEPGLSDDDLRDYLRQSYQLVAHGLSKRKLAELGVVLNIDCRQPQFIRSPYQS